MGVDQTGNDGAPAQADRGYTPTELVRPLADCDEPSVVDEERVAAADSWIHRENAPRQ